MRFKKRNHCRTRGPNSKETDFQSEKPFQCQKRRLIGKAKATLKSTHKTSRKDYGQIHVFSTYTCTRIYIVFNKTISTFWQHFQLGDFQIWGVGSMKYIKMIKQDNPSSFKNSLIEMYSKYGDIDNARGVFDDIYISKRCSLLECNDPRTCSIWPW